MGSALNAPSTTKTPATATKKTAKKTEPVKNANAYEDLLNMGGGYVPTSRASEKAWESILTKVQTMLPDVARDVLRSAAEEVCSCC